MKTGAWWQEKMNTQLGSWTELRHDNLLYAKESYTGQPTCSFPYSYVEPFPEFYRNLKNFGVKLNSIIQPLNFTHSYTKVLISEYCNNMSNVCDKLSSIAQKELNNISLSADEISFLRGMLRYDGTAYGSPFDGWYYNLFYNSIDQFLKKNFLVADIHTSAYDEGGNEVGWVKHVGTGKINLGVFVVNYPNDTSVAYVGPLYSYYDYTSENFLRLTDEEWLNTYQAVSLRPDWVNLYLADAQGLSKGTGNNLITGLKDNNKPINGPQDFQMLQNYPNPFNPNTVISFMVPGNMSGNNVELTVFDIQGRLVKKLVNDKFPAGNYLLKWEGTNDYGNKVVSGVYFCRGKINDKTITLKMVLLK
jgi:hypothetical protein